MDEQIKKRLTIKAVNEYDKATKRSKNVYSKREALLYKEFDKTETMARNKYGKGTSAYNVAVDRADFKLLASISEIGEMYVKETAPMWKKLINRTDKIRIMK